MNYHPAVSRSAHVSQGNLTAVAGRQAQALTRIIRARRSRRQFFPTQFFSDPAWDMLLALALAELEQRRVTVGDLCDAAEAPYTTALRYIQAMIDEGLAVRHDDPLDGRRKFLSLSPEASKKMSDYLDSPALFELRAA